MSNARQEVFTVILTGGIASGKTAVSNRFQELGVPVVDTDCIAREIVKPGSPALNEILHEFGRDMLNNDGTLDRARLRSLVFRDSGARARLEAILHPRIAVEAQRQVRATKGPYCVVVVPLYTESTRWLWADRVLVVDTDESIQIERVMTRDHVDRGQAEAILAAQASRSQRLAVANDVIENSGSLAALRQQVDVIHAHYLCLADMKKKGTG